MHTLETLVEKEQEDSHLNRINLLRRGKREMVVSTRVGVSVYVCLCRVKRVRGTKRSKVLRTSICGHYQDLGKVSRGGVVQ